MEVDTSPYKQYTINMEYEYTSDDYIFNCENYVSTRLIKSNPRKRVGPNLYENIKKLRITE